MENVFKLIHTKYLFLGVLLCFISPVDSFAQKDSLTVFKTNRTTINYRSYVISNDRLFALNDSGKLIIWDLKKLDTIQFKHTAKSNYTAISKDKNSNVFIATNKGEIFKIDPEKLTSILFRKEKYTIFDLCFDSSNNLFLIVRSAVYDPVSKKYWNKFDNQPEGLIAVKKSFIFFHKRLSEYFTMPQYTFLDQKGWWWMTASFGEFGSSLQVFDTQKKEIVNSHFPGLAQSGLLFPRSIFDGDNGDVYITSGLQHFVNSGDIFRINKEGSASKIYTENGLFIGPGTFNKNDGYIYYATSNGFYKADVAKSSFEPIFLFNPVLSWSREPMAVGISMAVSKLDFVGNNKLLFLTKNDGFGLYNGKSLTMFK